MSEQVKIEKIRKPKTKVAPLSAQDTNVPEEVGRVNIPSNMGRTRTGIQDSPERWGDRMFGSGDRPHPNAKPQDTGH